MTLSQDCNKIMAELLQPTIAQQVKLPQTVQASKPDQTPEQALIKFQAAQIKLELKRRGLS
jgi:hypothetical protein